MGERADDPSARRDEVRPVCLAQDEQRHLGLDDDAKRVRERAVEPEGVHGRDRRRAAARACRRRRAGGSVPTSAARAARTCARIAGVPPRTSTACTAKSEVSRARGVTADREQQQREPEQDRLPGRREPPDVGHAATRGQDRGTSGRPPAGGHAAPFAALRASPTDRGSASGPRNCTSCRSSIPNVSCTRRRASAISAMQSAERAPSAFSMKFAWRGEMSAPPMRWPLRPHASIRLPAPRSPLRVLEDAAERALVRRLCRLALREQLGRPRLDRLGRARLEPEPHLRDDLAGPEPRVAVGELELVERDRARVRPRRRRRRRHHGLPVAAVCAGVHAHAAPGGAGDRARRTRSRRARRRGRDEGRPRSSHRRPRRARPPRRAPWRARPRASGRARRRRRRGRAGSSRGRSSRPRDPPPPPSASAACSSSSVSGFAKNRAGPPVPIVVYRASGTCSSTLIGSAACRPRGRCRRRRRPAARRRPRAPPHALDARPRPTASTPASTPRSLKRIDDELAGDARDRLLARGVDVGDRHVVGGGQRLGELAGEVARARVEVRLEENAHRAPG